MDKSNTKNQDKSAFACIDPEYLQEGLTKREYFAGLAMQGICASNMRIDAKEAVIISVSMADDLIEELDRE